MINFILVVTRQFTDSIDNGLITSFMQGSDEKYTDWCSCFLSDFQCLAHINSDGELPFLWKVRRSSKFVVVC